MLFRSLVPDGSVFSTSDLGTVPHQHLDLSDLMNYYARYGMTLTYLGWTEDVAGYAVLTQGGIAAQGTITTPEDDDEMAFSAEAQKWMRENLLNKDDGSQLRRDLAYQNNTLFSKADGAYQNNLATARHAELMEAEGKSLTKEDGGYIVRLVESTRPGAEDPEAAAENLLQILPEAIAAQVVALMGQKLGAK